MLSTFDPQLFYYSLGVLFVYCTALWGALLWYVVRALREDHPGKRLINALRMEVSDFSGMHADLVDRFNTFQKREGMRIARKEKEEDRTIVQQAQDIVAQESSDEAQGKLALYRKLGRRH